MLGVAYMNVDTILLVGIALVLVLVLAVLFLQIKNGRNTADTERILLEIDRKTKATTQDILAALSQLKQENQNNLNANFNHFSEVLTKLQERATALQDKRLHELNLQLTQRNDTLQATVAHMMNSMETKLGTINQTVENKLLLLQQDNSKKLEQMRATVDEKLQKTLEERIGQSFQQVNQTLEQVFKSLGEMQTLATGVGDLKKVLSGIQTRGVLGEIQLGAILQQMLSPDQYETNCAVNPHGRERVEYAIKMPGTSGDGCVYLPVDAKFPADTYAALVDAYNAGTKPQIDQAGLLLEREIKRCAKDIHQKYIAPPHTTDFGILFLPFEGLYAEVVRRGLIEKLQSDYKIMIAGPTTMGALLNSLQMGFKTLAIQKRSSEVWNVLGAVKAEFAKFGTALATAQNKLRQADNDIETLVGTRTRQIQRKLKSVATLPEADAAALLETQPPEEPS